MKVGKSTSWLIKSDGKILGPFQSRQINDLIRERVLVPLDEVSMPLGRWVYLRDQTEFVRVIEEMRARSLLGTDDTTTANDPSSFTRTDTVTLAEPDDLTEDITTLQNENVQDVLFQAMDDHVRPRKPSGIELYTHGQDKNVKAQVQSAARWVWAVTAIVIFIALGTVVFRQFVVKPIRNRSFVHSNVGSGIDALEAGAYTEALDLFSRAHQLDPGDMALNLYLGILKIQIADQPLQGRQLLEQVQNRDDKDTKRVWTGIGVAQLKEGDYDSAAKSFGRALDADPLFLPAVINLGAVALYRQNWADASHQLQLAIKERSDDGAEMVMLTEAVVQQYQQTKEKRVLTDISKILREFIVNAQDYMFEAKVGLAYVDFLLNDKMKLEERIDALLNEDASLTELHRHNLFVHRGKADWSVVSQWCLKMTQDAEPTAHIVAFEALCLAKAGDRVEANRKINDALAQSPKDSLVQSVYGFILIEMNSLEAARVAIDKALESEGSGKFLQPYRLKAQICGLLQDRECERKYWKRVLTVGPESLAGLAGMVKILLDDRKFPEAKNLLVQGLRLSPNYRPFLPLNKMMSQIEDQEKARGL